MHVKKTNYSLNILLKIHPYPSSHKNNQQKNIKHEKLK